MKLQFDIPGKHQPDPFIFEDAGRFYLYVTAGSGVEAYSSADPFGIWHFEGTVCTVEGWHNYWAPCIIRYQEKYYLYFSCEQGDRFQYLHAAVADSPLGPFTGAKPLFDRFTIDAHVVQTDAGLFLFYAEDNWQPERFGTRVFVDRLTDPFTPAGLQKEIIVPTFDEEIFARNRWGDGKDWHTIEGPFWFREGKWQYVMYSGGCYMNDSYHIGFSAAESGEQDLTRVDFQKHTAGGSFAPVLIRNDKEEGTGHHSVLFYKGEYYAVYHGRDAVPQAGDGYREGRTARICKLLVRDGNITAQRME